MYGGFPHMKDLATIEAMSREDLIASVRQQQLQLDELERERAIVGESLIRANRLAEVIQNKAEEKAKEIHKTAELEYKKLLDGVDSEKESLLQDIKRLQALRATMMDDMFEISNRFQVEITAERNNIQVAVEKEQAVVDAAPTVIDTPMVDILEQANVTVENVSNTFGNSIDLTSLLVATAPAENMVTIGAPALVAEPNNLSEPELVEEFNEPTATKEVTNDTEPVDLNSLLASVGAVPSTVMNDTTTPEAVSDNSVENDSSATMEKFVNALQNDEVSTPEEVNVPVDLNSLLSEVDNESTRGETMSVSDNMVDINALLSSVNLESSQMDVQDAVLEETAENSSVDLNDLLTSADSQEVPNIQDVSDLLSD